MNRFMKFRNALRLVTLVGIMMAFLLLTVPSYPAIAQDKKAPEGLSGGEEAQATSDILEGKWSVVAVHTGKPGDWRHSGIITITEFTDGLKATFSGNLGQDDPKEKNTVKFDGSSVTVERRITESDGRDPDTGSVDTSQTWGGTLYKDQAGFKIEGRIRGGGTPWNIRHGNAVTFLARKQ